MIENVCVVCCVCAVCMVYDVDGIKYMSMLYMLCVWILWCMSYMHCVYVWELSVKDVSCVVNGVCLCVENVVPMCMREGGVRECLCPLTASKASTSGSSPRR